MPQPNLLAIFWWCWVSCLKPTYWRSFGGVGFRASTQPTGDLLVVLGFGFQANLLAIFWWCWVFQANLLAIFC
ncbi:MULTISPECIES: hypothetical protein [Desertifilum]|uniref:hypothetical protein n=1 Tax=Desertifilum TaxID=1185872 RepID=UPI00114CE8C1|nr:MULTISPECIES: hypothetical protein [Desertifilum]MBD2323285.1 hypothetical protein [Desertifilum sp. FACHB-866]MBD2333130.1 hypothetical protein [Desertifilum sp. FACHB-868]